jgi:hypothetical protein
MSKAQQDKEIISAAMSILGSRTSPKKKISSRLNAMKPRKKKRKGKKTENQAADHNSQRRIKRRRERVAA